MMATIAARLADPGFRRRLLETVALLVVFRLGSALPLPGLDTGRLFGTLTNFPGQDTHFAAMSARLSVFALGMVPLFSALMLFEGIRLLAGRLGVWTPPAPGDRVHMPWLRRGALLLAAVQAVGVAHALEGVPGLVVQPGWEFRLGVVGTLVAATGVISWLADEITRRGLANGIWLLSAVPFLIEVPHLATAVHEAWRVGVSPPLVIAALLGLLVLAAAGVVVVSILERTAADWTAAARHEPVASEGVVGPWPMFIGEWLASFSYAGAVWLVASGTGIWMPEFPSPGHANYFPLVAAAFVAGLVWWRVTSGKHGRAVPPDARRLCVVIAALQIAVCLGLPWIVTWLQWPVDFNGLWFFVTASLFLPAARLLGAAALGAVSEPPDGSEPATRKADP
jgi:SecY